MSEQLPPPPDSPDRAPDLRHLPGAQPARPLALWRRIPRRTLIALVVIGVIMVIGAINGSDNGSTQQTPAPGSNTITSTDCYSQGGHIAGDTCYLP